MVVKAATPAKSQPAPDVEPVPGPDLALVATAPAPNPARLLLDEQLIHEADLAQALGRTVRAVSNLAKKHGLRRVKILRRVYYRKEALRDFYAQIGQPSRRRSSGSKLGRKAS